MSNYFAFITSFLSFSHPVIFIAYINFNVFLACFEIVCFSVELFVFFSLFFFSVFQFCFHL